MHRLSTVALALLLAVGATACDGTDEPTIDDQDLQAVPEDVDDESSPAPDESAAPSEAASPDPEEAPTDEATPEPPTFEEVCAGREGEAFIEVLTPQPEAEVEPTFTVTGCGNTFEASYVFRVEDPDGEVLAEGFGTMSCGNGCVGEFEQEITVEGSGEATLVVFEESAEDGSEQHVVEVPLVISASE